MMRVNVRDGVEHGKTWEREAASLWTAGGLRASLASVSDSGGSANLTLDSDRSRCQTPHALSSCSVDPADLADATKRAA